MVGSRRRPLPDSIRISDLFHSRNKLENSTVSFMGEGTMPRCKKEEQSWQFI